MKYIMGVDCGGTKTEAIAYDKKGHVLKQTVTGFGNLVIAYEQALGHIKEAVTTLFQELGQENCQHIVLGIAGIDAGGLKERVQADLQGWPCPVTLMNDGQLAQYAILKGANGAIIIAGTGSVMIGRVENQWYRVGGWGHLFGDDGSAYGIARAAIQQCLAEYDQGQEPSALSQAVLNFFKVGDVLALTRQVYAMNKGQIAEVAVVVADLAATNQDAQRLLVEAGQALAQQVSQLASKMSDNQGPFNIGLNGSVIEKNPLVYQAFNDYLAEHFNQDYQLIKKTASCASGAYYYQKRMEAK
ncbi:N-acetylglucosamine kinase [Vagococcus zengguangii]|nr:BadF/BadG/BcrA/BcrD ATPase family protein [Vagococcus zengguangii]